MRAILRIMAAGVILTATTVAARAQDGVLTVTDGTTAVELDAVKLAGMEQDVIETTTSWTEGKTTFSGPSMQAVLEEAGFSGASVTAEALDGYAIEIPPERLTGDGAILATSMNDAPLPEDKAPYWIIFPYDQSQEMNDDNHRSWSVWALTKLTVR